ncbi:MAG: cell division protein SepF [Methanobrevibacter sp.]|uniref:cell division protein SepF n=1 Tax=Methanobrevibacter sp. TaxID=66852 RepID=UPI0026E10FB4|nr:cell division protein SepF [Methanobrevibacter sp.]MDO5848878.1 cell division protein SepF [Methanobrevibacter sp.]
MSFMNALRRSLGFEETEEKSNNLAPSYPISEYYDDDIEEYTIEPEYEYYSSSYEILLLKPKTIDDINYIIDQIIEEKNPVIVDFAFIEKESPANFKLAADKIKDMRNQFGVEAILLSRTEDKNLIIISPENISLVRK